MFGTSLGIEELLKKGRGRYQVPVSERIQYVSTEIPFRRRIGVCQNNDECFRDSKYHVAKFIGCNQW